MADTKSSDPASTDINIKMKVDGPEEESATKQDNPLNNVSKNEELKICSPSNSIKTSSTNPFLSDHNRIGKSILKPSLLSVNSSTPTNSPILRRSSFNPFSNATNDSKKDNNEQTKQTNGEVKFVPLLKNDSKPSAETTSTSNNGSKNSSTTFVFGQNLQERVVGDAKTPEALPSTSSISNGSSNSSSDMLFSSAIKTETKLDTVKEKETKSLTDYAREYEESRAVKRKYDEVEIKTGEEEETNVLTLTCKLFTFDKISSNWQERGRGNLRLNDFKTDDHQFGSRLVVRASGSFRVILNTKIWAEMTIDKASEKSIRLTAQDSNGDIKVFLIMSSIEDSKQLYSHLQTRLEREVAAQKRKKLMTEENSGEQ
ncbi:hypothetical protein ABEB36_008261 [Hypothenemus hampei]|uniref:RanBD1 domain-containing protein n=1 Tax=Hypothenemus hampei TaxID=57062 RepID=A0ABD1ELB6_HYPHA